MSERLLSDAVKAALISGMVQLGVFVECLFDGGPVRIWSGVGPYVLNGDLFTGAGHFGGIDKIEESSGDVRAVGIAMTLSGIESSYISLVLQEHFQGRACTVWLAFFDLNWVLIPDVTVQFKGRMDYPVIEEGGDTCTITVNAESILIDLERPRVRRYTNEDQVALYPGDRGMEFIAAIQNKDTIWKAP